MMLPRHPRRCRWSRQHERRGAPPCSLPPCLPTPADTSPARYFLDIEPKDPIKESHLELPSEVHPHRSREAALETSPPRAESLSVLTALLPLVLGPRSVPR